MTPLELEHDSRSGSPGTGAELSVVLVEDEPAMARVIEAALDARGFQVRVAVTGQAALDQVGESAPDLVLLDLGLPDLDGIEVCARLRRWTAVPIIVLSADGAEDRKIAALDEGADDYVTKPFSIGELLARIRVAQRHRQWQPPTEARLRVGALDIDVGGHIALLADEPLDLTRKEFALLALLARTPGRVLTHQTLLTNVWGSDKDRTASLRVHVNQLRRKLGDGPGHPQLVTEPGVGYRLLAP